MDLPITDGGASFLIDLFLLGCILLTSFIAMCMFIFRLQIDVSSKIKFVKATNFFLNYICESLDLPRYAYLYNKIYENIELQKINFIF